MPRAYAFRDPANGLNQDVKDSFVQDSEYRHATNLMLDEGRLRTRDGVRLTKLDVFGGFKGAHYHDPNCGVSCRSHSEEEPGIYLGVGREIHKLCLTKPNKTQKIWSFIDDSSFINFESAENYIIATNGQNNPIALDEGVHFPLSDSKGTPFLATSAHGRLVLANPNFQVSDLVYDKYQADARDILKFEEQSTKGSKNLAAPVSVGNIVAAAPLVVSDTIKGHTVVAYHGQKGQGSIFTIDIAQNPRLTVRSPEGEVLERGWEYSNQEKILVSGTSAVGPWALEELLEDQIFRSKAGIESITSAISQRGRLTKQTLSRRAKLYIDQMESNHLDRASVAIDHKHKRLFVTSGIQDLSGADFWVTANDERTGALDTHVWEGKHELSLGYKVHKWMYLPDGRMVGFAEKNGEIFFIESIKGLKTDIFPDGQRVTIQWSIESGQVDADNSTFKKKLNGLVVNFSNIDESIMAKISLKSDQCGNYQSVHSVIETNEGCAFDIGGGTDQIPTDLIQGRWFQFQMSGDGYVEIDAVGVDWDRTTGNPSLQQSQVICCRKKEDSGVECEQ